MDGQDTFKPMIDVSDRTQVAAYVAQLVTALAATLPDHRFDALRDLLELARLEAVEVGRDAGQALRT